MASVRPPRVGFSAEVAQIPSLPEACGPHLSPCLTSVCGLIPVIMSGMSKLHEESEASLQDPREADSPV